LLPYDPRQDQYKEDKVDGPGFAMGIWHYQAYKIDLNTQQLSLILVMQNSDQDFARYATPFEQKFSCLVIKYRDTSPIAIPVVVSGSQNNSPNDDRLSGQDFLIVVGHILTQAGDQFLVHNGVFCRSDLDSEWKRGVPIAVWATQPSWAGGILARGPLGWQSAGISETSYTVMTRVDGVIIGFLASRATGFVVSEFGPILFIASALAPLGVALVRAGISSLFAGESATVATSLVLDGVTEEAALAGFNDVEKGVIIEVRGMLKASSQMARIRQAFASGTSVEVKIGERLIQYEPSIKASGMTMFGENGFLLGPEAFTSQTELVKTLLHETYRLYTSTSMATGVSQALATAETKATFNFAESAYKAVMAGL
jgi:hypothetical protein